MHSVRLKRSEPALAKQVEIAVRRHPPCFGDKTLGPGDMVYMEDPHFEHEMHTEEGCKILFVQYPGPTTGARPVYEGRFNKKEAPNIAEEDLEH